jgi:hypothetical protein
LTQAAGRFEEVSAQDPADATCGDNTGRRGGRALVRRRHTATRNGIWFRSGSANLDFDIARIIRACVADDAGFFDEQQRHHPAWCTTKLEHLIYALQQDGQHKYGYDFETASKLLRRAGFSRVIDSAYNASEFCRASGGLPR